MSADEYRRVVELRALVSSDLTPYYNTHFNLLRWIQSSPNDSTKKIAHRLRHHLQFRKSSWNLDRAIETERGSHPLHRYWPSSRCGMSGVIPRCIIHMEQAGFMDYEGMTNAFSVTEVVKGLLHSSEQMLGEVMQIEKETGEQASILYVYDAGGIVFSKKLVEMMVGPLMTLADRMFTHYPELINEILLLMDPSMCPVFWNDANNNDFSLPMERPNRVPQDEFHAPPEKTGEELHIKARQAQWLEFRLQKGDALAFRITSDSSFGFGVVLPDGDEEADVYAMRQIFPVFSWIPGPIRVPIEDSVTAPESGLYKVWISNSRAWLSSITVYHTINIIRAK